MRRLPSTGAFLDALHQTEVSARLDLESHMTLKQADNLLLMVEGFPQPFRQDITPLAREVVQLLEQDEVEEATKKILEICRTIGLMRELYQSQRVTLDPIPAYEQLVHLQAKITLLLCIEGEAELDAAAAAHAAC